MRAQARVDRVVDVQEVTDLLAVAEDRGGRPSLQRADQEMGDPDLSSSVPNWCGGVDAAHAQYNRAKPVDARIVERIERSAAPLEQP